jgi:hypothetical protein
VQALTSSQAEVAAGTLSFRCVAIEDFELEPDEAPLRPQTSQVQPPSLLLRGSGSAESRDHVASDLVHLVAHPGHVARVGRQDYVLDTDAAVIADGVDHVFRAAVEP